MSCLSESFASMFKWWDCWYEINNLHASDRDEVANPLIEIILEKTNFLSDFSNKVSNSTCKIPSYVPEGRHLNSTTTKKKKCVSLETTALVNEVTTTHCT